MAFYLVYIREAHSTTGRTSPANERAGIEIDEPKSAEEREDVAETCREELKLTIPILVDGMDNATEKKWAAWPDRGYIIGADGKVKFKSLQAGKFKAADVEKALVEHLKPLPETGQK